MSVAVPIAELSAAIDDADESTTRYVTARPASPMRKPIDPALPTERAAAASASGSRSGNMTADGKLMPRL